jgi:hypothetical protein
MIYELKFNKKLLSDLSFHGQELMISKYYLCINAPPFLFRKGKGRKQKLKEAI